MFAEFHKFILDNNLPGPEQQILLAVSGGMDSVAMTELFRRAGYRFAIAHCNFGLRGKESDLEEEFVKSLARSCRVTFHCRRFDTLEYAKEYGISVQMAARDLRYQWLEELRSRKGYGYIATAHHLDDEVETFLINLSRGTGIAGLHGIPPLSGRLFRPLLFAWREQIMAFVTEEGLAYREDSSNKENKYRRNRIRHEIIPALEALNPSFRQELSGTMRKIKDAEVIYRQAVMEKTSTLLDRRGEEILIPIAGLKDLSPLRTWSFELLRPFGFTASGVDSLIAAMDREPGRQLFSPTHRLLIDRDHLIITPLENPAAPAGEEMAVIPDSREGQLDAPVRLTWSVSGTVPDHFASGTDTASFDKDLLRFPLTLRKWRRGDFFYPLGMGHKKKLSDFFIDNKVPRTRKEKSWLLCSGGAIVWVVGMRIDDRFKVTSDTHEVLSIRCFL